jgi:formamidopyrimidine-DNA glycosylase
MPELPEIETVVRGICPHVQGRTIIRVRRSKVCRALPSAARVAGGLKGALISNVRRRGKYLLAELDNQKILMVHLGMSGQLLMEETGEPRRKHMHLALGFSKTKMELRFYDPRRFGKVALGTLAELESWTGLGALGIEPLSSSPRQIAAAIAGSSKRLKTLLLEQRAVAGLGNIYVDETLFRAGLHPLRRCNSLTKDELSSLAREIKKVLRQAIKEGGSTIGDYLHPDGQIGSFQDSHLVYGRAGQTCPRCAAQLIKESIAGRGTHFCPVCQPEL